MKDKKLKSVVEKYEDLYNQVDDEEITLTKARIMCRILEGIRKSHREARLRNNVKLGK